ncbi:MAG: ribulose-phosphate 3-epimerase [bacterium]
MRKVMISPSILDSDFSAIKNTILMLNKAKSEYIHFDIMDGNFVPAITFGPKIIKPLRPLTKIIFDTHLMILNPDKYADLFMDAGSDIITVHLEAVKDMKAMIKQVKDRGKKIGVSIKPNTPSKKLHKYIDQLDLVLVMSVEPGFGGQKFMEPMLKKVIDLRNIIDKNHLNCLIEIDGGINKSNAHLACQAGVDIVVAGSAIFGSGNPTKAIKELRASFKQK